MNTIANDDNITGYVKRSKLLFDSGMEKSDVPENRWDGSRGTRWAEPICTSNCSALLKIRKFVWSLKVFRAYRKSCANPSRRTWQPFYLKAGFCRANCKKGYDMRKINAKYSIKFEKK